MTHRTIFLTFEQVLVIHEDQIDRYGGSHGLRDLALLESAIFRPQTTFADQELYPSIFKKAAALLHSLIFNHPFIDGNKRTAIVATILFLDLNSYNLKISQSILVNTVIEIETKQWDIDQISDWIEKNSA